MWWCGANIYQSSILTDFYSVLMQTLTKSHSVHYVQQGWILTLTCSVKLPNFNFCVRLVNLLPSSPPSFLAVYPSPFHSFILLFPPWYPIIKYQWLKLWPKVRWTDLCSTQTGASSNFQESITWRNWRLWYRLHIFRHPAYPVFVWPPKWLNYDHYLSTVQ